ncbi:hypothetical protein B566_EDAN003067, partial [Ephemera danica]
MIRGVAVTMRSPWIVILVLAFAIQHSSAQVDSKSNTTHFIVNLIDDNDNIPVFETHEDLPSVTETLKAADNNMTDPYNSVNKTFTLNVVDRVNDNYPVFEFPIDNSSILLTRMSLLPMLILEKMVVLLLQLLET